MNFWTDERVEELKALVLDGLSASQIAARMGAPSRNVVMGKIHRLGLGGRLKGVSGGRSSAAATPRPVPKPPAPVVAPQNEPAALVLDHGGHVRLLDLGAASCRWPHGDPRDAEFHFCGHSHDGEGPYCPFHHRVAFVKMPSTPAEIARSRRAAREAGIARMFGG